MKGVITQKIRSLLVPLQLPDADLIVVSKITSLCAVYPTSEHINNLMSATNIFIVYISSSSKFP